MKGSVCSRGLLNTSGLSGWSSAFSRIEIFVASLFSSISSNAA